MSSTMELLSDQIVEKWEPDLPILSLALLMACFADSGEKKISTCSSKC